MYNILTLGAVTPDQLIETKAIKMYISDLYAGSCVCQLSNYLEQWTK